MPDNEVIEKLVEPWAKEEYRHLVDMAEEALQEKSMPNFSKYIFYQDKKNRMRQIYFEKYQLNELITALLDNGQQDLDEAFRLGRHVAVYKETRQMKKEYDERLVWTKIIRESEEVERMIESVGDEIPELDSDEISELDGDEIPELDSDEIPELDSDDDWYP
jgi:mRNA-degrading endonuclease YafQ of YafQ-DinJ toxin-antitoxin module